MRSRCNNVSHPRYEDYGGRGIRVCPQWDDPVTGFAQFIHDAGMRPSKKLTLDRIDVNKGYEPGNVKWATIIEQRWNRRSFLPKFMQAELAAENAAWNDIAREAGETVG